ncbi:Rhodanese-like domain-containing protein 4 chloroplastic [Bienertia sinuspersici]
MEALNALGLKPICVLPDQSRNPRKISQITTLSSLKFPQFSRNKVNPPNLTEDIARKLQGSLVFLASAFSAKFAGALTYEEAIEQSVNANSATDFDAGSVVETIVNNPLIIAGGVAVIAVPLVLSQVFGSKPKPFGVQSAKTAYAKLADEPNSQLLDIRSLKESREVGGPDIRGLKKKAVSVVYRGEDKPGFLQKLSLKFKDPENTTLYILDKFDGNSELVAELVTANGFKSAYAIKDGAEGPRGWMEGADALPVLGIGAAAAAGLGLLAFTEIETVLQLLGSAAVVQVLSKKLLFAEQIGTALLPATVNNKSLPAPVEATPEAAVAENSVQKAESAPEQPAEAPAQPASEINSTNQDDVNAVSHPRPLSPYPAYPDFKPPTSPCPSQP